ncbi:MAG: hypothetical protein ACYC1Q_04425 [Bacteroidia bacterium]
MRTFILLLLTCLCLPIVQSCRDKDEPEYECTPDISVLLPKKAVSMFCFKEGSYWIYQREDSMYFDSVWVTSYSEGVYPVDRKVYNYFKGEKCYESRITVFQSRDGYFFNSNKYSLHERAPKNTLSYSEELFVLYDGWQQTSQIRLDFVGDKIEIINAYGDSVRHLDSINVKGTIYYDITLYIKQINQLDYLKESYYAPGFGMIRFKDNYDAWWNLISSNIVQ